MSSAFSVPFIVGPTASGKTAFAVRLAAVLRERGVKIEVVNADSRQVYRGMTIGTAKPTPEQQAAVRHHLIDVADPPEGYSLALFLESARAAIDAVRGRGHMPVVVGGTGQYVWGLVEGWQVPQVPPAADVRARLEREAASNGGDRLYARLAQLDPEAARLIDPHNVRRVIRALEVWEHTGVPFSAQRRKQPPAFEPRVVGIAVERDELYRRIDERVDTMVAVGWVEEVRVLLAKGYGPELPAFSSVGYREIAAHVAGESSLEEALAQAKTSTHRLARRQGTWFRRGDPRIAWVDDFGGLLAAVGGASRQT